MPYGIVDETKPGYVKVNYGAEDYKSDWIPVVFPFTYENKAQFNIKKGTQVFVYQEFDPNGIEIMNEVCWGGTYNDIDKPPFNNNTHGYNLQKSETLILHGDETNAVRYDELLDALEELKNILNELIVAFNTHTHPVSGANTLIPNSTTPLPPGTPGIFIKSITKIMSLIRSDYVKLR